MLEKYRIVPRPFPDIGLNSPRLKVFEQWTGSRPLARRLPATEGI